MTRRRIVVIILAAMLASPAHAEAILHAAYSAATDTLIVDVAYRGTRPEHRFKVGWQPCTDGGTPATTGRLIDLQGLDTAERDYRERIVLPLSDLPCRPVQATLRLGRTSHATVLIPEAP
jgi:hypothetical protein